MSASPAKTSEPIEIPFEIWTWVSPRTNVLDGGADPHTWRGTFEAEKVPDQDMPGDVWWLIYSKRLSRGQHWYSADADRGVLDGVHIGATWRIRLNRLCGGDAALNVKLLWPLASLYSAIENTLFWSIYFGMEVWWLKRLNRNVTMTR